MALSIEDLRKVTFEKVKFTKGTWLDKAADNVFYTQINRSTEVWWRNVQNYKAGDIITVPLQYEASSPVEDDVQDVKFE